MTRTNMASKSLPASWMPLKGAYEDELEPTSTVKAIARITLIGDEPIVPTLIRPPTQADIQRRFLQLAFSDEYLSGEKATADGEMVLGVFTLNEEQELYGYWRRERVACSGTASAQGHLHTR